MDIGINLPVMAPGLDRDRIHAWCERVDAGPWSSIAAGERINFPNPEHVTLLAAAAVLTERVRLISNVTVLGLHDPVMLAKQLATIDVMSGGRLTVGVGVGGREEDFRSVGGDWDAPRVADLQYRVQRMREVWSGVVPFEEALRPVEPTPVQSGGPPILVGALGPRSIQRAATYADGLLSFSFGLGGDEVAGAFASARKAWEQTGRGTPRLVTGAFVAVGADADNQMESFLRRYLNFLGPAAEYAIPVADLRSTTAIRDAIGRVRDLGADELLLTPTSVEPDEVDRLAEACFG